MNHGAEVGTSGVLCAATKATLMLLQAVGWSVNLILYFILNTKDATCVDDFELFKCNFDGSLMTLTSNVTLTFATNNISSTMSNV